MQNIGYGLRQFREGRLAKLLVLISLSFATSCTQTHEDTAFMIADKRFIFNHDKQPMEIKFSKNSLSDSAYNKLCEYILAARAKIGKISVHVTIPNKANILGHRNAKILMKTLNNLGIAAQQIHKSAQLPPIGKIAQIVVESYQALPANCSEIPHSPLNKPSHSSINFGCAVERNFLAQIPDPIVFFKGQQPTKFEVNREMLAISRYREMKDKPLESQQKSDNGQSQGGQPPSSLAGGLSSG